MISLCCKGASSFEVKLADAMSSPISIYAIDEDLDIVIFKSDRLRQEFIDQGTISDKDTSDLNQGCLLLIDCIMMLSAAGTRIVNSVSSKHLVSEILRDVNVKDIDTLIKFGTRPT